MKFNLIFIKWIISSCNKSNESLRMTVWIDYCEYICFNKVENRLLLAVCANNGQ